MFLAGGRGLLSQMSPSAELIFIVFERISQCSALENEENQKRGEEKNPDCSRALNYLSARTIKVEGKQEMIPACDIWKHCKFSQCGTRCSDGPRTKTHLPIWPSCANVGWVSQWQAHQARGFFLCLLLEIHHSAQPNFTLLCSSMNVVLKYG